ncbi:3-(3-hydroxy-phenyl)propionate transporter MhpT [Nitrospirillum amazonense]|uniref:3-(3-hydroxy-phenyl)propionate transporter MhpT n=1 Tax=Nitrospirillum amazonense TaxID=28077 RepID=UPI002412B8F3|nr:3-(3-hydroxy-phenyl)propionate transporter MhpT [Nitrospirillum amazonense]MDG3439256.1 3-(3-hydroxy-phenyl)propionate transporter MhpT [Nitrospirillum amazonense]
MGETLPMAGAAGPAGMSAGAQRLTMGLCFLAAAIEGFDLQSAGVAAPRLGPAFQLDPTQMSLVFSAAIAGLIVGALVGGRVSDLRGRKVALMLSLGVFGLFSCLTALAWDYPSLLAARFLTGLGLGGAFPNLIAIASESTERGKAGAVAIIYAGMPLGGALAAVMALRGGHGDWQTVFWMGGVAPLALLPILAVALPAFCVAPAADTPRQGIVQALFAPGRRVDTGALWLGSFFALLVLYLLLNWLPVLLLSRGLPRTLVLGVQIVFNMGGACGSGIAGQLMDRVDRRLAVIVIFLALALALAGLAGVEANFLMAVAAVAGAAVLAAQALIYGLAPSYYPAEVRGQGVGAVVAAGRLGSVAGPLLAGQLIASGGSRADVLMGIIPMAVLSGIATFVLVARRPA